MPTHIIVKNGRVAVQNGRVVTSAGGAPCCCGGGSDTCNETILVQSRFRFDMDALSLNATLSNERYSSGSGATTASETQISLQIPSHTFYFGSSGLQRSGFIARGYNNGSNGGADVGADYGQTQQSEYGNLCVDPIGTITNTTTTSFDAPFPPPTTTQTTGVFKNLQVISFDLLRDPSFERPFRLVAIQLLLNGCESINGADGQPFDQYIEIFFEESFGNAVTLRNGVNRNWWGDIPVEGKVPFECGFVSASTGDIGGRRYRARPGAIETQVLMSLGPIFRSGDYNPTPTDTEPDEVGTDDVALFPQSITLSGSGFEESSESTIDFSMSGFVSEHYEDTGDPPYQPCAEYMPACEGPLDLSNVDIGDPDVIPNDPRGSAPPGNDNLIESHMSPITKCRGCGG